MTLLKEKIIEGKLEEAVALVNTALESGMSPEDIINKHLTKGMEEIGHRYEEGKAFVPNLLLAARAMKGCLEILKPLLTNEATTLIGTAVIGTVKGDLHDIGKNLVASMLEGCGFKVINLGVDVSAEQFVQSAKENDADIICLSALLTTTMNYMKEVVEACIAAGIRNRVKIMVGGAPLSQEFADKIGADGFSVNANGAVLLAKRLKGENAGH